jgi:tRNA(fMet)-specific endonuclease VapC
MTYFLDTNILVHMIRGHENFFFDNFGLDKPENDVFTSVVVNGELRALAFCNNWGNTKWLQINQTLSIFPPLDINTHKIIQCYAEIDAFSRSRHPTRKIQSTARKMTKNDIWIAATAAVINATLLTTDHDFDHLNHEFLNVSWIDPVLIT